MPFYSLPSGASPVLAGDAPPTGGIGNDGDLFLDRTGKTLYGPKESGSWPSGIDLSNGAPGPTGILGPTGPSVTGPTGIGATGPTGLYAFAATGPTAPTGTTMTQAGAVWLNTDNGKYYVRYDDAFLEIGVQGEQGRFPFFATGPTAPVAPTGSAWLDTDTGKYFLKYDDVFVEIGVQGERGPTGPTGFSFNWRSAWSTLESYLPGDTVHFGNSSYVCVLPAAGISQFPFNNTFWRLMASGSVAGPTGATGPSSSVTGPTGAGITGPTGPSISTTGPQGPTGAAGTDRGLNRETITGNITLVPEAALWQILTPTGNALEVTLPTGIGAGFELKVVNADDVNFFYFDIKTPAGVTQNSLYFGAGVQLVFDGLVWRSYYLYNF